MLHRVPESLNEILKPRVKVTAVGSPYEVKDILKGRGYKWNNDRKEWYTPVVDEREQYEAYSELLDDGEIRSLWICKL